MGFKHFLLVCATVAVVFWAAIAEQGVNERQVLRSRFTCTGRASGYYADVDTGCQVYHMCDGLGRQFSYTCPNTTLFQQRMLICDHWYMVNCSMSERDYSANLLIGQRDKPFVSDAEMSLRTPRPDILSVPANSNYYNGLKEAESKFQSHPGNSIVGIADSISSANNNGLDSDKVNYRPPTSWSTGTGKRPVKLEPSRDDEEDGLAGAASQRPRPTVHPTPSQDITQNTAASVTPTPPSTHFLPPFEPSTTPPSSEEMDIDIRMKNEDDPVVNFIRRFDPNSPDSIKTSMTKKEILDLNAQLPNGQSSAEDDRTPRKNKNSGNDFNRVESNKKGFVESSRFDTVNTKPEPTEASISESKSTGFPTPANDLLPPKNDFETSSVGTTTTIGPPIYYDWKWAAPAFDLEPPKASNGSSNSSSQEKRNTAGHGRSPFSSVTRPPQPDLEPVAPTKNTEYNISSYFVPDYIFPLDNGHPGYEDENAHTSFQVEIAKPGRASYGENPACPHCHPAYLNPGSCEPCIVKR